MTMCIMSLLPLVICNKMNRLPVASQADGSGCARIQRQGEARAEWSSVAEVFRWKKDTVPKCLNEDLATLGTTFDPFLAP